MIRFFTEDITYQQKAKTATRQWLSTIIKTEGAVPGDVNFILCSDDFLYDLNVNWLNHDTLTDVITFDFTDTSGKGKRISGDIYISLDRVRDNARELKIPVMTELSRIMAHGVLHLLGYGDKKPADKKKIRMKEDHYLKLHPLLRQA